VCMFRVMLSLKVVGIKSSCAPATGCILLRWSFYEKVVRVWSGVIWSGAM